MKSFILSHDPELLESSPKGQGVELVNLERLPILDSLRGRFTQLAEFRFYVSESARTVESAETVLIASARWDARFSHLPQLRDVISNPVALKGGQFFAPLPFSTRQGMRGWLELQEKVHPGIGNMLDSAIPGILELPVNPRGAFAMGGNLLTTGDTLARFSYWLEERLIAVDNFMQERRTELNFRCPFCEVESAVGLGRWGSSRGFGFIGERLIAVFLDLISTFNKSR